MDKPIRTALVGYGLAGAYLHGPLIEAARGLVITVVATSRPDALRVRESAPRVVADPMAACQAPDADLVVIATPNETHFPLAMAALDAGKHVVLDKPFCLSTGEADRLIEKAETKGLMLTVFHNRRRDGDFRAVAAMLASGELGELRLVEARWDRFRPQVAPGWRNTDVPGAGVLFDLGPHLLDQALCLFGVPDGWTADVATQRPGARADDYFEIVLRYGPMRYIASASCLVARTRPRFALHGSRGSFLTFGVDAIEEGLRLGRSPGDPDFAKCLTKARSLFVDADGGRREADLDLARWPDFYVEVAEAIRLSKPPPVDPRDARWGLGIIEAALAAAD